MRTFVGCLIGFQRWLVVSFTGLKCGKGKLIEAFVFAVGLYLGILGLKSSFVAESSYFVVVRSLAEI